MSRSRQPDVTSRKLKKLSGSQETVKSNTNHQGKTETGQSVKILAGSHGLSQREYEESSHQYVWHWDSALERLFQLPALQRVPSTPKFSLQLSSRGLNRQYPMAGQRNLAAGIIEMLDPLAKNMVGWQRIIKPSSGSKHRDGHPAE